jgi:hypothetical protein
MSASPTPTQTLEDLLAQWWRDSYPHAAPINNQTAALMTQFASWILAFKSREIQP